jgi:hypothetical protein
MRKPANCKIIDSNGNPIGDNPIRKHRSYIDCVGGGNPMKASFDNCFITSRLGFDPITGKPLTVFDEQINREKQILESLGELVIIFRKLITPDKNDTESRRCPVCWDGVRKQARSSCPICNGYGVVTTDPNITRVNGYQWLQNPERDDSMFFVNEGMAAQKLQSQDMGLMIDQNLRFWTVPIRNCDGKFVNIIDQRDIIIRYVFDKVTQQKVQELGRYEVLDTSYSLAVSNQLMHMEFTAKRLDPGVSQHEYALPNFL